MAQKLGSSDTVEELKQEDPSDPYSVEHAKIQAQTMNAQLQAGVEKAENRQKQADIQLEANKEKPKSLESMQQHLHLVTKSFSVGKDEQMNQLSQKLGVEMTPEIRNLGSNDLISKALVDHAV